MCKYCEYTADARFGANMLDDNYSEGEGYCHGAGGDTQYEQGYQMGYDDGYAAAEIAAYNEGYDEGRICERSLILEEKDSKN